MSGSEGEGKSGIWSREGCVGRRRVRRRFLEDDRTSRRVRRATVACFVSRFCCLTHPSSSLVLFPLHPSLVIFGISYAPFLPPFINLSPRCHHHFTLHIILHQTIPSHSIPTNMGLVLWTMMFSFVVTSTFFSLSHQQPPLDSSEQESLYEVLHSLNPSVPWRTLFPDDLCLSAPHGVVCDFPTQQNETPHIVELSFGYVSDETPNPPCSPNATLNPLIFTSFPYLSKLFFYNCFNQSLPFPLSLPSSLEELVFINNPSFFSPLDAFLQNLTSLRRLILIGNAFHGEIPFYIGGFLNLEEVTLSRNNLSGEIPSSLGLLRNLKVLDLSGNKFEQCLPHSLGNLSHL